MNQIILLLGPSGSGKNTLMEILEMNLEFHSDDCSDILSRLEGNFKLGDAEKKQQLSGKRNPDDVVIPSVCHVVREITSPLTLLAGYCRSDAQGASLSSEPFSRFNIGVIYIDTHLDICKERLLARRRPDDTPESIANKQEEFVRFIRPAMMNVVERYSGMIIDGTRSEEFIGSIIDNFQLHEHLKEGSKYNPVEDMLGVYPKIKTT